MFSKTDKTSQTPTNGHDVRHTGPKKTGLPSIISEDLKIVGSLQSDGEVQIDGVVDGDIRGHVVTISKGADIRGSIFADTVHISGQVNGQIEAKSVMIAKPARVVGDILHQALAIEAGAHIDGYCRRLDTNAVPGERKVGNVGHLVGQPVAAKPATTVASLKPAVSAAVSAAPAAPAAILTKQAAGAGAKPS